MADWSSLPSELIDHIADCLLATNDVDCYMDFRAICTSWRSATEDPKGNPSDLRFRPRSSRATRASWLTPLALLRRFYVVASTHGGFFVLADREPPHAALVLNPLTGHLIRFVAPIPPYRRFDAAVMGSSPSIVLLCDCPFELQHMADPASERFTWEGDWITTYFMNRMAVEGGMYANGEHQGSVLAPIKSVVADKIDHLNNLLQHGRKVFRIDNGRDVLEPVSSLGNLTIFEGEYRCFAVDADKFPSVEANCIYYTEVTCSCIGIYMYDLKGEKEQRICPPIHTLHPKFAYPPFAIIQLLSSYTNNVLGSQIVTEKSPGLLSDAEELCLNWVDSDCVDYKYD